ncbi:MAG TPA: hypothetical protein VFZ17_11975, partial [Acidimicrobiia bacterium]|nr:hypothetical protein [Acidimicrobiia bacterium]
MRRRPSRSLVAALLGIVACFAVAPAVVLLAAPAPPAAAADDEAGSCSKTATGNNYNGTNAERDLTSVFPDWVNAVSYPCEGYPADVRGIRLAPDAVELVVAGRLERRIPVSGATPIGLPDVVRLVDDPSWIREPSPGVIEILTAFVQAPGTSLLVAAPDVTEVRLVTGAPGVFFGGLKATARFDGVTVTSWDETTQSPSESSGAERPHVLYED